MSFTIPPELPDFVDKCDIYRPYGAATATYTDVDCRIVPRLERGGRAQPQTLLMYWTHWVDFKKGQDVRDATSRVAGTDRLSFGTGDELKRSLDDVTETYVVVFVEDRWTNTDGQYRRAYCIRDVRTPI